MKIFSGLIPSVLFAQILFVSSASISGLVDNKLSQFLLNFYPTVNSDNDVSLLGFHKQLVELPSISGDEEEVGQYLKNYLESKGLTVELQNVSTYPLRQNVYAYLGKSRDNKVLLTSHIDTVPPYLPYYVEGNKIYGRGTCDAKGSVAAQVAAFFLLVESGKIFEGDVALLYVVGEEVDGKGMLAASKNLGTSWDSVIFGEPTELKLGVGHKGNYLFHLQVEGKASHSGYPELGISANEILIPVLNDLLQLELPSSDLLGLSTLNIGKIEGGIAANVIPADASASVFIRVANDLNKIDKLVHGVVSGIKHLQVDIIQRIDPQYLDFDVPGFDTIVLAYATDIPNLTGNFKRYLYGPGSIHVAHGDDEFVTVEDLEDAVTGYQRLVLFALENN